MPSKRLEELQKKLKEAEEHDGEPLTEEELGELEGGVDLSCGPNQVCFPDDGNP